MKKSLLILIALLTGLSVVVAADDGDGGQPGAFRSLALGGRPSALGGAFTAIADGGYGYLYNPAGIAQVRKYAVSFSYRAMHLDRRLGYASVAIPARENASLGISWIHAGTASLEARDVQGNIIPDKDFSSSQNLVGVTFAKRFVPQLSFGGRIFYVQHNIGNINAYSIGVDFGVHSKLDLRKTPFAKIIPLAQFGFVVENIGANYKWTTTNYWQTLGQERGSSYDEKFPTNFRLGTALIRPNVGLLAADFEVNTKSQIVPRLGAEYTPYRELAFRTGLDDMHPTFGVGLFKKFERFALWLDISYLFDKVGEGNDLVASFDLMF